MIDKLRERRKDIFVLTLVTLFLCATAYFLNGRASFFSNNDRYFNNTEFFVGASLIICLEVCVLIYAVKSSFKIKTNKWLLVILMFFFLTSIVSILGYNGLSFQENTIGQIDWISKLRCILLSLIIFGSLYVSITIIPKFVAEINAIRLVFYLGVAVASVALIYSLIFERQIYVDFFTNKANQESYAINVPRSYTAHRNIYGFLLFLGMVSEGFLELEKPHWRRLPIMSIFLLQQFFTFSKTCMILGAFFIVYIFVHSLIISIRQNNYTHALFLIIYTCISCIIILICLFADFRNTPFECITNYSAFLKNELFKMFKTSMQSREISWTLPVDAVLSDGTFSFFFGFGYGNEYSALGAFYYGDSTIYPIIDNAWGLMLVQNGVFGMAYGLFVWGIGIYLVMKSFMRKSKHAIFYAFLYLCLLGRTFTENNSMSYLEYMGMLYFCFLYLPMLVEETNYKKENVNLIRDN